MLDFPIHRTIEPHGPKQCQSVTLGAEGRPSARRAALVTAGPAAQSEHEQSHREVIPELEREKGQCADIFCTLMQIKKS